MQTLARRHGIRAASAAASVRRAAADLAATGGGGPFLDELAERLATGIAIVVAVIDPQLVVLAGDTAVAGGEQLRSRIERRLRHLTPLRPRLALTAITGHPGSGRGARGRPGGHPGRPVHHLRCHRLARRRRPLARVETKETR